MNPFPIGVDALPKLKAAQSAKNEQLSVILAEFVAPVLILGASFIWLI